MAAEDRLSVLQCGWKGDSDGLLSDKWQECGKTKKKVIGIKKLRLYLETTAFNYYFDENRAGYESTVKLFEAISAGEYEGYSSVHVMEELKRAQEPKRSNMLALVEKHRIRILTNDARIVTLAELYIANGIIPATHRLDSLHIASASVYALDCVVSYNFQHINRAKTKILTAHMNREAGYNSVVICTSEEVFDDGL